MFSLTSPRSIATWHVLGLLFFVALVFVLISIPQQAAAAEASDDTSMRIAYEPDNPAWEEHIASDEYFLEILDAKLDAAGNCLVKVTLVGDGSIAAGQLDVQAAEEYNQIYMEDDWRPKDDVEESLRVSNCTV